MMNRARILGRAAIRLWLAFGMGPGTGLGVGVGAGAACGGSSPAKSAARRADVARAMPGGRDEPGEMRPHALSYLQEDYQRIFPERVRLARYGEVRYAASDLGDAAGDGDRSDAIEMGEAPTLVVVDQVHDRVRVVAPQDHFRLLVWLDVSDLYTVVTEAVPLAADGVGSGPAIRLHPGLPVQVDGERAGMAHVVHRDGCISLAGWVPRTALGTQFMRLDVAEANENSLVAAGTAVYDRPRGRQVATFLADCEVVETGPENDGHRPILYATEWLEVRGWVAAGTGKASGTAGGASWGYGLAHLGLMGSRTRFRLGEGTCLYARRGGPAVGMVTEDVDAPLAPPVNGWWQVPLETGWGDLTVWVAEESSAAPAQGRPQGRRGRGDATAARKEEAAGEGGSEEEMEDEGDGASGASLGDGASGKPSLRRCR